MSTDISAVLEYKKHNEWSGFTVRLPRNYQMFAKMAGIRNDRRIRPIAEPRGIPNDASYAAKELTTGGMVFGESWLSEREVRRLIRWVWWHNLGKQQPDLHGLKSLMQDIGQFATDMRLIFVFSS